MDIGKAQEEIARLNIESALAHERLVTLSQGMVTGDTSIDEACLALRELGNIQIDICELRLRVVGDALQATDISGLMNSLNLNLPTIG